MSFDAIHWTEYLKAVGPSLIAIFVTYIAYQQWQINRANLRERLFERRFAVFKKTQTFLSVILRDAKFENKDLFEFNEANQMARFLFDAEIRDYLDSIRSRASKMRMYQRKLEGVPVGEKRSQLVDRENDELKWLTEQFEVIFDKFEPYLGFKHHK